MNWNYTVNYASYAIPRNAKPHLHPKENDWMKETPLKESATIWRLRGAEHLRKTQNSPWLHAAEVYKTAEETQDPQLAETLKYYYKTLIIHHGATIWHDKPETTPYSTYDFWVAYRHAADWGVVQEILKEMPRDHAIRYAAEAIPNIWAAQTADELKAIHKNAAFKDSPWDMFIASYHAYADKVNND